MWYLPLPAGMPAGATQPQLDGIRLKRMPPDLARPRDAGPSQLIDPTTPVSRQQVRHRDPPDLLAVQLHRDRVPLAIDMANRITGLLPLAERPGADLDDPAVEVDDPVDRDAEARIAPQFRPAVLPIARIGD